MKYIIFFGIFFLMSCSPLKNTQKYPIGSEVILINDMEGVITKYDRKGEIVTVLIYQRGEMMEIEFFVTEIKKLK